MVIYVVKNGDTVSSIARRFGVSVQRLIADNGLEEPDRIVPGQSLIILIPAQTYRVRLGDTLYSIATDFQTTPDALIRNNPWLALSPVLKPDTELAIRFTQQPTHIARVNGYAYPYISPTLLRRELPFLSTLTIFGYGFTMEGELIEPNDEAILPIIKQAGVEPVLLLASIDENGNFNSYRASMLFGDSSLQNNVLYALVEVMQKKGYRGLDIDFEYILPEDADEFLRFVQNAVAIMHRFGFFVNVDLAPKTSVDQPGLLYEAHNYAELGAAADTVLLMTYEWGYAGGPPQAVAPLPQVTEVVDFAVTQIPRSKLLLGVPNYGYDWTLPFVSGVSRAVTIGNQYAVTVAGRVGSSIRFDEAAQSPSFPYRAQNAQHIVWFEDARSIQGKLELMLARGLRGLGYWNLMRPFAQNWALNSVTIIPE